MVIITISIIAGIFILTFVGGFLTQHIVKTPMFKNENETICSNSIAEFRRVSINNDSHAILIRGKSLNNPVLLFLHAGLCLSETGW